MHQRDIGIVFQAFGLLPSLSAVENVALPLRVRGEVQESRETATAMLERLDLRDRLEHRTFELSGGQQQRIAVARALVGQPTVVLADEPISEVDEVNGERILTALWEVASRGGAVVVATHDPQAIEYATRAVLFRDGLHRGGGGSCRAPREPDHRLGRAHTQTLACDDAGCDPFDVPPARADGRCRRMVGWCRFVIPR